MLAIERFLQTAYTDERLAALLAHAEDGKLSWHSCCCLIGVPTADHALRGSVAEGTLEEHYQLARARFGLVADRSYMNLSHKDNWIKADAERRAKLIPMIRAEIARRDALRTQDGRDTRDNSRSPELAGVLIGD